MATFFVPRHPVTILVIYLTNPDNFDLSNKGLQSVSKPVEQEVGFLRTLTLG